MQSGMQSSRYSIQHSRFGETKECKDHHSSARSTRSAESSPSVSSIPGQADSDADNQESVRDLSKFAPNRLQSNVRSDRDFGSHLSRFDKIRSRFQDPACKVNGIGPEPLATAPPSETTAPPSDSPKKNKKNPRGCT